MDRAKMFRISDSITGTQSVYKVQNARLDKICKIFKEKELVNSLKGTEKSAYIKYILPVINGEKFDDLSGVFFGSLLANYDIDEYQINMIQNKDRDTIDSDDWIENLIDNIEKAIKSSENVKFKEYQQQENRDVKAVKGKNDIRLYNAKVREIKKQYLNNAEWHDRRIEDIKYYNCDLTNIISICYRIDDIYYQKQLKNDYEARIGHILRETECLPVDVKRKFLSDNKKYIDILFNAIDVTVKGIYQDIEKAKAVDNKELVNAKVTKGEYEMLKGINQPGVCVKIKSPNSEKKYNIKI